jgi:hypothetical protein
VARTAMQSVPYFCSEFPSCSIQRNVHPVSRFHNAAYTNRVHIVAFCVNVCRSWSENYFMMEPSLKLEACLLWMKVVSFSDDGNVAASIARGNIGNFDLPLGVSFQVSCPNSLYTPFCCVFASHHRKGNFSLWTSFN